MKNHIKIKKILDKSHEYVLSNHICVFSRSATTRKN